MTDVPRDQMMNDLRKLLKGRLDNQYPAKGNGRWTASGNEATINFMCGAAAVIEALGLDKTHGLTGMAFLVSVRGPDAFLKP